MKVGIYAGSFDPVTLGHLDVIERASRIVDRLVIGVLNNTNKKPSFTADERVEFIKRVTKDIPNVEVKTFDGLTVDFAKQENARILVRGLRAVTDFEYELQIAQLNHKLDPKIDTIFLTTSVEYSYLSSSIVKEIAHFGGDISKLVPKEVRQDIVDKLAAK
ncbi:MAG: pantetheine-phosphate adenylyltransferase [Lachnospiraceae bacterium]|nr:pantetheine-phosphate adenylyltransferase [Lachnospiraceae bacterium]